MKEYNPTYSDFKYLFILIIEHSLLSPQIHSFPLFFFQTKQVFSKISRLQTHMSRDFSVELYTFECCWLLKMRYVFEPFPSSNYFFLHFPPSSVLTLRSVTLLTFICRFCIYGEIKVEIMALFVVCTLPIVCISIIVKRLYQPELLLTSKQTLHSSIKLVTGLW